MKSIMLFLILISSSTVLAQDCFEDCWKRLNSANASPFIHLDILQGLTNCKAPNFAIRTINNDEIRLDQLKGKIVVLNFWFIGCKPCIAELPALNKLVEKYASEDIVFIAFSTDSDQAIKDKLLPKYTFKYKLVSSKYDLSKLYCIVAGYPTNMVLDREGMVKLVFNGGKVDESAKTEAYNRIAPVLDALLKNK